jgi:transposase
MTLQLTGVVHRNYTAMADPTMENWDNVLRQVLYAACDHQYAGAGYMEYTFNPALIKQFITDTVKYRFAHEVFERREVDRRTFNGNEKFITWGGRADADT